jgi:hypothetical protein
MRIFEINIAPQYTIKTQFDYDLKAPMLRSAFDLVGIPAFKQKFDKTNKKGWGKFFGKMPIEKKRILIQIADEESRLRNWRPLDVWKELDTKVSKFVQKHIKLVRK